MKRRCARVLVGACASCAILAAGRTNAQDAPAPGATDSNSVHDIYLEVDINGQQTSVITHFRERQGHLSATGEDLRALGLELGSLGVHDTSEVALDSISGLHYTYNAANQTLALTVPDALRRPYRFDTRSQQKIPPATSDRGFIFNYDAYLQSEASSRFAVSDQERYFSPAGSLSNTGIAYLYQNNDHYVRLDTAWSTSDASTMRTLVVGDAISASLDWSRSVRFGGIQWGSNFNLRPDLITFPVPSLSGSAVVPTAVDLYVNSIKQYSTTVPSGPFIANDIPGISGGGQATIVTHDALGRTVTTSVPLYIDTRMLAAGLSSYSGELGFLRQSYGTESFSYDPHPMFSASIRYGATSYLTLEGHSEGSVGLFNAGVGDLVRLGNMGVVNTSMSASTGHLTGYQASLGYQLVEPRFSIDAQSIRAYGNYGDLAANNGSPIPTATDTATLSLPILRTQSLAFSYIGTRAVNSPTSHIGTLSYTQNIGSLVSIQLSVFRDFHQHNSRGVFLSLSLGLGHNTSINANAGSQNGQFDYSTNATRPPDYDGGVGWSVTSGASGNVGYRQGQVQYLGRYGELTGLAQSTDHTSDAALDLSGSVVVMDGSLFLSRHIDDGFALVSTDGEANIPVLHENRVIGKTDGSGHFLIPDLNSYQLNQISIDSLVLPPDAQVSATQLTLVPKANSGVLAHFPIAHYRAATVILVDANGKAIPAGSIIHHQESGEDTIVGYDGIAFVQKLKEHNHLHIEFGGFHCAVSFDYVQPKNGSLPTIGPLTCKLETEGAR